MDGETEEAFSQRRHTNGQEVHEKMLNITNHQGMQIKTTMRYPFAPIRMDFIKNTRRNKCWWSCGVRESSCTVGGNVNWYRKTVQTFLNKNRSTMWSSTSTSECILGRNESRVLKKYLHFYVYCSVIWNSQDMETMLSIHQWMKTGISIYIYHYIRI